MTGKGSIPNSSNNNDREGDHLSDQQTNDDQDEDAVYRGIIPHRGAMAEYAHLIYDNISQGGSSKNRGEDEMSRGGGGPAYDSYQH